VSTDNGQNDELMVERKAMIFFLKYPEPGQVKTRLAEEIGDQHAVGLYKSFVRDLLGRFELLDCHLHLFMTPPEKVADLQRWLLRLYPLHIQVGNNLGERMRNAFYTLFSMGYKSCIVAGSDYPDMPSAIPRLGLKMLSNNNAVISPSLDGGYCLLGFRTDKICREAFQDIDWSTSRVFQQTMTALNKKGVYPKLLPQWQDVDTFEDLIGLVKRHQDPDDPFLRSHTMNYIQLNHDEIFAGRPDLNFSGT